MNEKSEEVIEQNFRDIAAVCLQGRHATPGSSSSSSSSSSGVAWRRTEGWVCGGDCLEKLSVQSLSQCSQ
ncbi:hypothetical protein E2C01_095641 [Portunus trituberculatus]|uniref:Uncharacterized protein n=1 Tax=Portunus trituberculatus TaxID=210409 RepID=A0A5B7K6A4_PORTR|nr:hypothetical protein [Portunus trituberculatus]